MGIFSIQIVADTLGKLLGKVLVPHPGPELSFPEIPGRRMPLTIPTRHGPLACQAYLPPESSEGKPGVYLNLHGGGFVAAGPEQDDAWCRFLAHHAGVVVINADYAVAPKHRFPVALEQAHDAAVWVAADNPLWDGKRLCIGGQSAGGSLSAGVCRLILEQGGPRIALQVLVYPPLDCVTDAGLKHTDYKKALITPFLSEVFNACYIPDPAKRTTRLVSPAWGTNDQGIEGIAPAVVLTCEYDRLHDEGVRYAKSLEKAGALVDHYDVPGVDHCFNLISGTREIAEKAYRRMADHVKNAVAK